MQDLPSRLEFAIDLARSAVTELYGAEYLPASPREYVGKVLSNIQIYRARIGDQPALRLDQDLWRVKR